MAKSVKPANLGEAIAHEMTLYHRRVITGVNEAGEKAAKALVQKTKATAPKRSGSFRRAITYNAEQSPTGDTRYIWGAKAPHHRLTHLLVKGYAKATGGRVDGDPFLQNALNEVLPEYENEVKEALTE